MIMDEMLTYGFALYWCVWVYVGQLCPRGVASVINVSHLWCELVHALSACLCLVLLALEQRVCCMVMGRKSMREHDSQCIAVVCVFVSHSQPGPCR